MAEVPIYHYIRQSNIGEVQSLGKIIGTIEADRENGERHGAVQIKDLFSHAVFEVDERDYWLVRPTA